MCARKDRLMQVFVTSGATGGDNRDTNSSTDELDQLKIITAKAAIAAYARDKKLPSAEQLAAFRELDDVRSPNKALRAAMRESIKDVLDEINGNRHCLSSESLRRAGDQIRIAQSSGPYRDFVGAATQQLTDMIE